MVTFLACGQTFCFLQKTFGGSHNVSPDELRNVLCDIQFCKENVFGIISKHEHKIWAHRNMRSVLNCISICSRRYCKQLAMLYFTSVLKLVGKMRYEVDKTRFGAKFHFRMLRCFGIVRRWARQGSGLIMFQKMETPEQIEKVSHTSASEVSLFLDEASSASSLLSNVTCKAVFWLIP